MQHKCIRVFGTVQGVGFRFFVERLAKTYHIHGTVQNVNDYVEVHAQGNEPELETFIQAVITGASPASKVTDYEIEIRDFDPAYTHFKTIY